MPNPYRSRELSDSIQGNPAPRPRRLTGEVWLALVTAAALMAQAVIAKNVLDAELDFVSQYAALWVFIVFLISGARGRAAEIGTAVAVVAVAGGVLALYSF